MAMTETQRMRIGRKVARKFLAVALLGLVFSNVAPSLAVAQSTELQPVLDRLQRLERDIRTLNIQISRGGQTGGAGAPAMISGPPETANVGAAGLARFDAKLSELEDEQRATTGKVETITFQLQQINQRLEKLVSDIDYRLSVIESSRRATSSESQVSAATTPSSVQKVVPGSAQPGTLGTLTGSDLGAQPPTTGGNPTTSAVMTQPATVPEVQQPAKPASVLPPGGPKEQYRYAFSLLRQAEYARAEAAFSEFINLYADDPLTGNARYWLGETYYVRGQYVKAAEVFLAAYQGDTKGAKAPDTLLKLGMSLGNLDKRTQACASFDKLTTDFTKASPVILDKVKTERLKYGCK